MPNIIPIDLDNAKIGPAKLMEFFGEDDDLIGNNAGGFPVISIKGKVFHVVRGDERTLIKKPGEEDPAASIEVVILAANPAQSKVYYSSGYVEGATDKPDCYSNDGVAPAPDAEDPQAIKCEVCPHNVWGSKITEQGKKARACADSRRIAVCTVDTPADPMLLRIPAASMAAMSDYAKLLKAKGYHYKGVVTRIGFDYSVAHPLLNFRCLGVIGDAETVKAIKEATTSDLVAQIIGTKPMPTAAAAAVHENPTYEPPPVKAAPAPAPAPEAKVAATPPSRPRAAPKAAKPEPAPLPQVEVVTSTKSLEAEVEDMLDKLNFDV